MNRGQAEQRVRDAANQAAARGNQIDAGLAAQEQQKLLQAQAELSAQSANAAQNLNEASTAFAKLRQEIQALLQVTSAGNAGEGGTGASGGSQAGGLSKAAEDLNNAADKIANLGNTKVQLDTNVGTIDVAINGGAILEQFGDAVKAQVLAAVAEQIQGLIPNVDGSTGDPSLGTGGSNPRGLA